MQVFTLLVSVILLISCSSEMKDFRLGDVVSPAKTKIRKVAAKEKSGKASSKFGEALWTQCVTELDLPLAFFFPSKPFKSARTCQEPSVLAALGLGYNVLIIESIKLRPPFDSAGDLGGEKSLALVKEIQSVHGEVAGVWAEGLSSILAMRFARMSKARWVIVGQGVYDFEIEETLNLDEGFQRALALIKSINPKSYQEIRSISWDFEGFAKNVYLYDRQGVAAQRKRVAQEFVDGLSAGGHKAAFKLLETNAKTLTNQDHGLVINSALNGFGISRKP